MENLLKTLVYDGQVSLTVADTTELVKEAVKLHGLKKGSATVLGKVLSAAAFTSAALKEERGEVSFTIKGNGTGGSVNVSGNQALHIRGYLENPEIDELDEAEILGEYGSLTVIRDDGYSRPFVGSCAYPFAVSVDALFEEYYRVSEQLPTFLATKVELDEDGDVLFAGLAALQPLPFTDEATLNGLPKGKELERIVEAVKNKGIKGAAKELFSAKDDGITLRRASYTCHCSRLYLTQVLAAVGEEQMRQIIREDGELRVHCHYCNTDYVFSDEDADKIFARKK